MRARFQADSLHDMDDRAGQKSSLAGGEREQFLTRDGRENDGGALARPPAREPVVCPRIGPITAVPLVSGVEVGCGLVGHLEWYIRERAEKAPRVVENGVRALQIRPYRVSPKCVAAQGHDCCAPPAGGVRSRARAAAQL